MCVEKGKIAKLINWLVLVLENWLERRGRMFVIMSSGTQHPYLVRYILFKSKRGCIYIHRFLRSDDLIHHDHPWNFYTYIVDGQYIEEKITKGHTNYWFCEKTKRDTSSIAYRKSTDIHRVILDRDYTLEEKHSAPLTVCFIGPRLREWGFWKPLTSDGNRRLFIDWRQYLKITPDDPRWEGHE